MNKHSSSSAKHAGINKKMFADKQQANTRNIRKSPSNVQQIQKKI
jgi:hypothetical protein